MNLAALLRLDEHRKRRPVLDRTCGIASLELRQENVRAASGQALQAHQRRVADRIGERWIVAGHVFHEGAPGLQPRETCGDCIVSDSRCWFGSRHLASARPAMRGSKTIARTSTGCDQPT